MISEKDNYKFYNARENKKRAPEWRMYYYTDFLKNANIGNLLVLCRTKDERVFGFVFQSDSNWFRAAQLLFNLQPIIKKFQLLLDKELSEDELDFYRQCVLSELGLEVGYIGDKKIEILAEEIYSQISGEFLENFQQLWPWQLTHGKTQNLI